MTWLGVGPLSAKRGHCTPAFLLFENASGAASLEPSPPCKSLRALTGLDSGLCRKRAGLRCRATPCVGPLAGRNASLLVGARMQRQEGARRRASIHELIEPHDILELLPGADEFGRAVVGHHDCRAGFEKFIWLGMK